MGEGGNTASHEEALQRNALHRQQLAEVIEKHNQVLTERQQEVAKKETDNGREGFEASSGVKTGRKKQQTAAKFKLEKFLKNEPKSKGKDLDTDGFIDIKEDVVENLDLIVQLAEEISELDSIAFDYFSNKNSERRKKPRKFSTSKRNKEKKRSEIEKLKIEEFV